MRSCFPDLYNADRGSIFGCLSVLSFIKDCGRRYKGRRGVSVKNGRLYVHVKSKRRTTGLSYPQTDIDTDTNTVAGKDAVGAVREPKNSVTYGISMNSSINPFARVMYITSKEVAYVIPFEDGQIITDNGTKASEFDYVGRSGEKKILWQENDEVKKAPARVEKFVKESLEKEEDDPADENAVKVLWVNPQMPLQ